MGRPKGSPNKIQSAFREALEARGFNIADKAAELYEQCTRDDVRQKILDMMAKYSYPTFKPVDQNGEANDPGLSTLAAFPSEILVEAFKLVQARKAKDASGETA